LQAAAAHTLFVEAARRGSDKAMFQAGLLAQRFGPEGQAAYWFSRAASLGNAEALQRLGQQG
jgi:TPR repeat protein